MNIDINYGEETHTEPLKSSEVGETGEHESENKEKTEYTYTVTLNGENAVEETVLVIKITDGKISSWED